MGEEHPIDIGIKTEKDSIEFYSERAANVKNRLAKQMLESFVADERKHLEKLKSAKSDGSFPTTRWSEETAIVMRSKNTFEEVPEDVRKILDSDPGDSEVMAAAIQLEQEGRKYYLQAADSFAEGSEKNLFTWLAKIGIWFLHLPCFTHIFIQFPPFDIPYNLYHRETLWSNTEKSGEKMYLQKI